MRRLPRPWIIAACAIALVATTAVAAAAVTSAAGVRPPSTSTLSEPPRGDADFIARGLRIAYLAETMQRTEAFLWAVAVLAPPPPPPPPPAAQPPAAAIEPPPAAPKAPSPPPAPPAPEVWSDPAFAAELLAMINRERAAAGLRPLASDSRLAIAAGSHAQFLASTRTLSHTGRGGSTFGARIVAAGYPSNVVLGEIIAFSTSGDPASIMASWLASPSHHAQIMSPAYIAAGAACASTGVEIRCVVDFGG